MILVYAALALLLGGGIGYGANLFITKQRTGDAEDAAKKMLEDAKQEAKNKILEAKEGAIKISDDAKKEERDMRLRLDEKDRRIIDREKLLESKLEAIDRRTESLTEDEKEIEAIKQELRDIRSRQIENLEKISNLKKKDAESKLMAMTEKEIKNGENKNAVTQV